MRVEELPAPRLRGRIDAYWGIERDLRELGGRFTITPDAYVEILVWASAATVVDGTRRRRVPRCMFVGLLDRPLVIEARGIVRCAAIRLPAWARCAVLARADREASWGDAGPAFPELANDVAPLVRAHRWPEVWRAFDAALSGPLVLVARPERGGVGRRQRERRTRAATAITAAAREPRTLPARARCAVARARPAARAARLGPRLCGSSALHASLPSLRGHAAARIPARAGEAP